MFFSFRGANPHDQHIKEATASQGGRDEAGKLSNNTESNETRNDDVIFIGCSSDTRQMTK